MEVSMSINIDWLVKISLEEDMIGLVRIHHLHLWNAFCTLMMNLLVPSLFLADYELKENLMGQIVSIIQYLLIVN